MSLTNTTHNRDAVADAARMLSQITEGYADYEVGAGSWSVSVPYNGRRIRIAAIDGEWNAGVNIYIFNRSGVVIGQATIHCLGMSAHFVATTAAALNREIR